jgi:hypothetical protein
MPDTYDEDPTIPPAGKRSGKGANSILPFLKRSLASKPQVQPQPEDEPTVPQFDPPPPKIPRPKR